MTTPLKTAASRLLALALAGVLGSALPAEAQRPPTQANPLDRSDLGRSKQDPGLKGLPVPPWLTK